MNIRPVGAELFHADGRTDMMKLTVAFRNFAYAPKKRNPYFMTSRTGIKQLNPYLMQKSLPFWPILLSYGRAIISRTACALAHSLV